MNTYADQIRNLRNEHRRARLPKVRNRHLGLILQVAGLDILARVLDVGEADLGAGGVGVHVLWGAEAPDDTEVLPVLDVDAFLDVNCEGGVDGGAGRCLDLRYIGHGAGG